MVKKYKEHKADFVRRNEQIRIPQVRVIYDGQNLGVMSTRDALQKARALDLDLVEVSAKSRPPVCNIMDYGKFKYDKQKKDRAKHHTNKEKEVSFRYVIDDNDLLTKANQIRKFLAKGMKVKIVVKFKAREKAHKDKGFAALNKLIGMLEDAASVEKAPGFEGHNVTARLDALKGSKDDEPKKHSTKTK